MTFFDLVLKTGGSLHPDGEPDDFVSEYTGLIRGEGDDGQARRVGQGHSPPIRAPPCGRGGGGGVSPGRWLSGGAAGRLVPPGRWRGRRPPWPACGGRRGGRAGIRAVCGGGVGWFERLVRPGEEEGRGG